MHKFDGESRGRGPQKWLEKLCVLEDGWSEDRLLKQAGVLLIGKAGTWFRALIDDEIKNWSDFKKEFCDKYMVSTTKEDEVLYVCRLLIEGPKTISLEDYVFLLKEKNRVANLDFTVILNGISKHVPEKERSFLIDSNGYKELVHLIRERKIKSFAEIKRRATPAGITEVNKKLPAETKPVNSTQFLKSQNALKSNDSEIKNEFKNKTKKIYSVLDVEVPII